MQNIDRHFIGLAIVAGLAGMLMGIGMGMTEDFALTPVHAHINLVGWVSLSLFGLGYRLGIAKNGVLARWHFWVAAAGTVILPIGIYFADFHQQPLLAIMGSVLTLGSMVLFGVNFLRARGA